MKNKKRKLLDNPAAPGRACLPVFGALLSLTLGQGLIAQVAPEAPKEDIVKIEKLVAEEALEDKALVLPTEPTRSVFGMSQSLAETPRSATVVPSSLLDSLGIRNSEDLIKIAPSSYSNFRFGLQGNISIRNQTSDFYFRGMRRIDPQGNFRTMWTANDSLEIVRGPSSPIYGLGRIGGYVNFNPKTARLANTGQYLTAPSGDVRITMGSFDKKIITAEVGGPVEIPFLKKKGGYHVYLYDEDSKAFKVNNFDKQKLVQSTLSFNVNDSVRIETGGVYQHSNGGLPGGINRTTVDTISKLNYWDGGFKYQLDTNRDGSISEREVRDSYFVDKDTGKGLAQESLLSNNPLRIGGNTNANRYYFGQSNDPLFRLVPWQGDPSQVKARGLNPTTITMAQFKAGYTQAYSADVLSYAAANGINLATNREGYQLRIVPTKSVTLPTGKVDAIPNETGTVQNFFLTATFDNLDRLREDIRALREWPTRISPGPAPFTGTAVPVLTQPRFEATEENRQRIGLLFNTDARFGPTTVFLRTNLSREKTDRTRRIDSFDPATGPPLVLAPDFAEFANVERDQREVTQFITRDAANLSVGGKTTLDHTELDATLGFGFTREFEPSTREAIFRDTHPFDLTYDLRDDAFLPRLTFVDSITLLPANSPSPAGQFAFHSLAVSLSEATDRELTARFNLKHNFNDATKPNYVKFGGALQQRHREVAKDQQFYNPGFTPLTLVGLVDTDTVSFHNGGYIYGPMPDADAVTTLRITKPDVFSLDAGKSLINSTTGDTTVTETIWAAYGMGRFEFGKWTVLSGLRVEGTHDSASGMQPAAAGTFVSAPGRTSYVNLLPGFHLRYEPAVGLVFRSSFTRALSRPAYAELPPSLQINFTDLRSRVGNPNLKPFLADNYDFSVDVLNERLGLFSASLFYKHITDFILDTQKPVIYAAIDPTTTFIEFQRVNGGPAETMGTELSWQSLTWKLPLEALGKGSVGLSYTLLHSSTHYPDRPGEDIPFYRQPDHQISFTIRQEGKRLSTDFALRYRSSQLEDTIAPGFDNFRDGGFEADFSLAYKYSKTTRVTVGAANLLNRPIHNYSGTTSRMNQYQRPGIDFSVGVQWKS